MRRGEPAYSSIKTELLDGDFAASAEIPLGAPGQTGARQR